MRTLIIENAFFMSKKVLLIISQFALLLLPLGAQAQKTYTAESPRNQEATYDEAANTVTIKATAPSKTEYDWDTYEQFDLPYISYILVERHAPSTEWPTEECGRVVSPKPGEEFTFVDKNVSPDQKYEYRLSCYVDATRGSYAYVSTYTGVTPGAITEFTATTKDHKTNIVDLAVTAPTKSVSGKDLTGTMFIDIQLYEDWNWTTLHSIENVQPGQKCTYQHTDLKMDKSYHYRAVARIGSTGVGEGKESSTYVGLDYPDTPMNLTANATETACTLTWEAPLRGGRGGCCDPENLTYTLTRVYPDKSSEEVAKGIKATKYVDTPNFKEEKNVVYTLIAENTAGKSLTPARSKAQLIGAPCTLPFTESFANQAMSHHGWQTASTQNDPNYTYEAWEYVSSGTMYFLPNDEIIKLKPQDEDNGFASCKFYSYSPDGQTESLISPHLSVAEVKEIQVKLFLWNATAEAFSNQLRISISEDNAPFKEVWTSQPTKEGRPLWEEVKQNITFDKKVKVAQIRLDAVRHDGPITNVYIDNISIESILLDGITTPDATDTEEAAPYYLTLEGKRIEEPQAPGVYIKCQGNKATKVLVR